MAEVHAGAKFEILKDAERCRTIRAGLARHQLSDSPYLENRLTKFVARRARLCLGTRRYFSADASGFRRHFFWQRAQSFSHLRARHPVRRSRLTLLVARRRLTLCMAAVVSAMGLVRHAGTWILIGVGLYGVSIAIFAYSQVFWISVMMLAFCGAGDTISSILRSTINQMSTPDELRGRMSSINSIFTSSGPQLGQFESGLLAAWLGAQLSALTGGLAILAIVALVAIGFPQVQRSRISHR